MQSAGTRERAEGNRAKLLRGAIKCLREKGYARTTARDLVAASGTNLASIGYHYGSKEALLNEALVVGFDDWVNAIERTAFASASRSSAERLELSLTEMLDRFEELQPFLASFVEAFPQAVRSPELRERLAASYEAARQAGTGMILRALEADGLTLEEEHARILASLLTALCDGLMLQWLLDPEPVPSSGQVMEALSAGVEVFVSSLQRQR